MDISEGIFTMERADNLISATQKENGMKRAPYETPAIIYEGKISVRAGSPFGGRPGGVPGGVPGFDPGS